MPSPGIDLGILPVRVDRKMGATLITRFFFPISPRTLERWPLPTRLVVGRALYETAALFAHAQALLDAAPVLGKKAA
jgi:hypothetical protein